MDEYKIVYKGSILKLEHITEQFFYDYFTVYIEKFLAALSITISIYKVIAVIVHRIKGNKTVLSIKIYIVSMISLLIYHAIHYKIFHNLDIWYILIISAMTLSVIMYQCLQKNYHKFLPILIILICYFYVFLGVETNNLILFILYDLILLLPSIIRIIIEKKKS